MHVVDLVTKAMEMAEITPKGKNRFEEEQTEHSCFLKVLPCRICLPVVIIPWTLRICPHTV